MKYDRQSKARDDLLSTIASFKHVILTQDNVSEYLHQFEIAYASFETLIVIMSPSQSFASESLFATEPVTLKSRNALKNNKSLFEDLYSCLPQSNIQTSISTSTSTARRVDLNVHIRECLNLIARISNQLAKISQSLRLIHIDERFFNNSDL